MSYNSFNNAIFKNYGVSTGKLKFGGTSTTSTLSIHSSIANQLDIDATNAAGKISLTSGTGGLAFNSAAAGNGGITMTSAAASSWTNTGANTTLSTLTSGNLILNSINQVTIDAVTDSHFKTTTGNLTVGTTGAGGNLLLNTTSSGTVTISSNTSLTETAVTTTSIDAGTVLNLGTSTATSINVGNGVAPMSMNGNVTITGNLSVSGTSNVIDSTTIDVGAPFIVVNSDPGNNINKGGLLVQESASTIVAGTATQTGLSSQSDVTSAASAASFTLDTLANDTTSAIGTYIEMTSGPMSGQYAQITDINTIGGKPVASVSTGQTVLTGSAFVVSGGGTTLTGTGSAFTTDLSFGDTVQITDVNGVVQTYIIQTVVSATSATTNGSNANDITGVSGEVSVNGWLPTALTAPTTYVVSSSGTVLSGSGTAFTTELQLGASILLTIGGVSQAYVVSGITDNTNATLNGTNTNDGTSTATTLLGVGQGITYSAYLNSFAGAVYDSSASLWKFETASNQLAIPGDNYLNIQALGASFDTVTSTATGTASNSGSWSAGTYTPGTVTGTNPFSGAIGVNSNVVIAGNGGTSGTLPISGPVVEIAQTTTGTSATSVIELLQSDNTKSFLTYSGESVSSGTTTDITSSLVFGTDVDGGYSNDLITNAQQRAYLQVLVTDNSASVYPNKVGTGTYYVPLYTLA